MKGREVDRQGKKETNKENTLQAQYTEQSTQGCLFGDYARPLA